MRLLVLYQASDVVRDQPGYHDGFSRLVSEGHLEDHKAIPYLGVSSERGWNGLWQNAYETALGMEADAILLQFFHGSFPDPAPGIRNLRALPQKPIVVTTLGDGFGRFTKTVPRSFLTASALSDISFLTGMGYVGRQVAAAGGKNLVLMPNGCCQVRFSSPPAPQSSQPDFDLVFIGSRIRSQNPFSHFYWVSRSRVAFVQAATKRYGKRFGLFGKQWEGNPSWQGPICYAAQHQAYNRGAVAVGGPPNASHDYYTSDRVPIAIAAGIPLIDHWVAGVDRIFEPARDWWLARDDNEMFQLCDRVLEMPNADRIRCGLQARERILARHTQYHRCQEMISIVSSLRQARLAGRRAPLPELGLLSESGTAEAAPAAILGWDG